MGFMNLHEKSQIMSKLTSLLSEMQIWEPARLSAWCWSSSCIRRGGWLPFQVSTTTPLQSYNFLPFFLLFLVSQHEEGQHWLRPEAPFHRFRGHSGSCHQGLHILPNQAKVSKFHHLKRNWSGYKHWYFSNQVCQLGILVSSRFPKRAWHLQRVQSISKSIFSLSHLFSSFRDIWHLQGRLGEILSSCEFIDAGSMDCVTQVSFCTNIVCFN